MTARLLHLHSSFNLGGKEARCVQLINAFGAAASHTIVSAMKGAISPRCKGGPRPRDCCGWRERCGGTIWC